MLKVITVILSLLVAEPAIAANSTIVAEPTVQSDFRTVESLKDQVRTTIFEMTGEEVADPSELVPLYPATLEGDEPLCGPDDPVDNHGYCAEYYRVKAGTTKLIEEFTGEDDDANVGCNTAAAANTKPLILLCLMSVILLALRLKRKRRICSNQK